VKGVKGAKGVKEGRRGQGRKEGGVGSGANLEGGKKEEILSTFWTGHD
jgi:hypothetical protein